ncbi:MAG TPA: RNA polymerase sigma factor [Pyrinomonadaceae bacterium]|jgi:RNA polymerase sigma-70 factor (ECF subfamily)|nr:RNA polymerase sigma factor [Pyrinomonadaceae bacterium]
MTDEKLLQKASRGDEAAFVLLYERHHAPLHRFAYRMLGSAALAEEIVQDLFLGLIKAPGRFDSSRSELRTYLFAAARNLANKHFRHGELALDEARDEPCPPEREEPLRKLLDEELSNEVQMAVAALPPLQREALILFEYEEMSLAEIAAVVGTDTGTIKSRLHRARGRLRRSLAFYFKSAGEIVSVGKIKR